MSIQLPVMGGLEEISYAWENTTHLRAMGDMQKTLLRHLSVLTGRKN